MLGFDKLDFQQILSTFLVLIGIIDIIGSIPIILQLKAKGKTVSANKATFLSWGLMVGFFYGGNFILKRSGALYSSLFYSKTFSAVVAKQACSSYAKNPFCKNCFKAVSCFKN